MKSSFSCARPRPSTLHRCVVNERVFVPRSLLCWHLTLLIHSSSLGKFPLNPISIVPMKTNRTEMTATAEKEECLHWTLADGANEARIAKQSKLVDQHMNKMDEIERDFKSSHAYSAETMIQLVALLSENLHRFLAKKANQELFDINFVKVCWSKATDIMLRTADEPSSLEEFEYAQTLTRLGIHVRAWLNCGQDEFISIIKTRPKNCPPRVNKYWAKPCSKILTRRNLIVFLSKRIPCMCLGRTPRTDICQTCGKEGEDFMCCSRCKVAAYCSKDCQVKEWPEHKKVCGSFKKAREAGVIK